MRNARTQSGLARWAWLTLKEVVTETAELAQGMLGGAPLSDVLVPHLGNVSSVVAATNGTTPAAAALESVVAAIEHKSAYPLLDRLGYILVGYGVILVLVLLVLVRSPAQPRAGIARRTADVVARRPAACLGQMVLAYRKQQARQPGGVVEALLLAGVSFLAAFFKVRHPIPPLAQAASRLFKHRLSGLAMASSSSS